MPGDSNKPVQCLFRASDTRINLTRFDSVCRANRQLASQNRLQRLLLDTQKEALVLWQEGDVMQTNACFDELISSPEPNNFARTCAWRCWLSAGAIQHLLHTPQLHTTQDSIITNHIGNAYHAKVDYLVLDNGPAQLLRIDPEPISMRHLRESESDSVTGLPARSAFIGRWQLWLQSLQSSQRYSAFLINFPDIRSESGCTGINGTLQDLLIFRASSVIEQHFTDDAIVGRVQLHSLLMVQAVNHAYSRQIALKVKALLGNLGGLVDDSAGITIKTLTLSSRTLTALEVLDRLEKGNALNKCSAGNDTLGTIAR